MAKFFTSGWQFNDGITGFNLPQTDLERKTAYLMQCWEQVHSNDTLYILGDMADDLDGLIFYDHLPPCYLYFLSGELEHELPNFEEEVGARLVLHSSRLTVKSGVQCVELGPQRQCWRMAYRVRDLEGYSCLMPSLCGETYDTELHDFASGREPIISVRASIHGGIVSEEQIMQKYAIYHPASGCLA